MQGNRGLAPDGPAHVRSPGNNARSEEVER